MGVLQLRVVSPTYQVAFAPGEWGRRTRSATDCYAYGLNLPEIGTERLGRLMSNFYDSANISTPEDVRRALSFDGLTHHPRLPDDASHLVAVFWGAHAHQRRPGVHIFRRDSNNYWSHKYTEGGCSSDAPPTQRDWSGQKIADPRTCDRGPYSDFIGFYSIPYEGLVIAE